MKKLSLFIFAALALMISSCDVHEWPDKPEKVSVYLRLNYQTNMTTWEHDYNGSDVIEQKVGTPTPSERKYGAIRYIIRTYSKRDSRDLVQEFTFTRDISDGYDHGVLLDLIPGDYNIMVWSDLTENENMIPYHNAEKFTDISLQGDHAACTDFRDAFRGFKDISVESDIREKQPDTLDITMERPVGKFEFIANDVTDFIEKEATRVKGGSETSTKVSINDYKVVFYYVSFMPHVYSLISDKAVDAKTNVLFETTLKRLSDTEASIGFDYVFVNTESTISVQIGIFDKDNIQLSMSAPIDVPVKRNFHTMIRGKFLMLEAAGGVGINPDYWGDHNIVVP